MKKIIFLLILILIVVGISGYIIQENNTAVSASEKVLMDSNISTENIENINLAIPEGTSTVKVEYSNLSKTGSSEGILELCMLRVTPQEGQPVSNNLGNLIDVRSVSLESTSYLNDSLELKAKNAKSLVIAANYLKGHIKVTTIHSDKKVQPGYDITNLNFDISSLNPPVDCRYETLPQGATNIIIEYNNLTSNDLEGLNSAYFQFVTYNVEAEKSRKGDIYASNVNESNIIDIKTINLTSTPVSGKLTLNINGAKSIGIIDSFGKGNVVKIINFKNQ